MQLYYTGDSPVGNDRIAVLVTEDHIIGWQTDYGAGDNPNYDHMHVLRDYLTDIWGDEITNPTGGETIDRTYTMPVPSTWNPANCKITAFVGEYQSDVYQARTVPMVGGTTLVTGLLTQDAAPYRSGTTAQATTFNTSFTNALGADEDYIVSLTAVDAPASWASALEVNGSTVASGSTTSITDAGTAQIDVNITPDAAPGIGNYLLTVSSSEFPMAPVLQQDVHVISGVHDLIVTNPQAEPWEALYMASMVQAGEQAYAVTTRDAFIKFGEANALSEVLNVYRNVSWTFPSITDDEVAVLSPFMDNGGNLMIAGQDIGWDQGGDAAAYGTPATQAFYADHMLATFVADGSSSSNLVNFADGDAIFGAVPNSSVANVFAGNTYPDQITPIAPATGILTYNATSNIGGIRAQTPNFKLVYFGIGPEQMSDAAVGRQMIQLSHDWFYGMVSIEEFDAAIGSLGQAYPVPANGVLNIPVNTLNTDATLEVFDAMGRLVKGQPAGRTNNRLEVDTRDLGNGVYSYRLRSTTSAGTAHSFVVAH